MSVSRAYIANTPFDQFDPNSQSNPSVAWALYDGGSFRTWASRGPAIQASHQAYSCFKLYEYVSGRWELRAVKPGGPHPTVCADCGCSTMQTIRRYEWRSQKYVEDPSGAQTNTGKWAYRRQSRSKLAEPVSIRFACKDCA